MMRNRGMSQIVLETLRALEDALLEFAVEGCWLTCWAKTRMPTSKRMGNHAYS